MTKKGKQTQDLEDKLKRTLADYANLEKRIAKEKSEFIKLSNAVLLDKLLAVLDDLERAEDHLKDKGLTMALSQFRIVLKADGVEEIKAQDKEFDAEKMDCTEVVKGQKNKVIKVVAKGYQLNGCILRPAKVKVGGK